MKDQRKPYKTILRTGSKDGFIHGMRDELGDGLGMDILVLSNLER